MKLLDGKVVKQSIMDNLKDKLSVIDDKLCFVVIYVSTNDVSDIYINSKKRMAHEVGYDLKIVKLDKDIDTNYLLEVIDKYNIDNDVDGIMVELPLPSYIDYNLVRNRINPLKDIEGVNDININSMKVISPVAMGVRDILNYYNINLSNKNVVIVGRSVLVGMSLYNMFIKSNMTVKLCHSKTNNLSSYTKNADILIVCVGKSNFINGSMVKKDAVVIDIGTNVVDGKLCGDVDFDSVSKKASFLTPVPFGVGQVTSIELGYNIYNCYVNKKI